MGKKETRDLGAALYDLFVAQEAEEQLRAGALPDVEPEDKALKPEAVADLPMPFVLLDPGATALRYCCSSGCGTMTFAIEIITTAGIEWVDIRSEHSANLPKGKKDSGIDAPAVPATRGYMAGLQCPTCGTLLVRCLARDAAHHAAAACESQFQ